MNADGSCALTCSDYHNTKQHQCRPDTFCASLNPEQRKKVECKGRIRGCYGLEDELSICVSVSEDKISFLNSNETKIRIGILGCDWRTIQICEVGERIEVRRDDVLQRKGGSGNVSSVV